MTSSGFIMVVEDDKDIREVVTESLELMGYTVQPAANGQEALDLLKRPQKPFLIFLDLMMPIMDGWEFRKRQQADPTIAEIPIVIVTADGNAPQKASQLGVKAGIKKPFELEELLKVTRQYCTV